MFVKRIHDQDVCRLCGSSRLEELAHLTTKPAGETDFGISPERYTRTLARCADCGVYLNLHHLFDERVYQGNYNQATYAERWLARYTHVRSLPPEQSDNKGRVRRIHHELESMGRIPAETKVLDVGTGLCVFLAEMKDLGYRCFALDPDAFAVRHAVETVGVEAGWVGTTTAMEVPGRFDLITFNKVLEHVVDPGATLAAVRDWLYPGGRVYVELPDAEGARAEAGGLLNRCEFFIEHLTIYTPSAVRMLAERAGMTCEEVHAIKDPSGKRTLWTFLQPV